MLDSDCIDQIFARFDERVRHWVECSLVMISAQTMQDYVWSNFDPWKHTEPVPIPQCSFRCFIPSCQMKQADSSMFDPDCIAHKSACDCDPPVFLTTRRSTRSEFRVQTWNLWASQGCKFTHTHTSSYLKGQAFRPSGVVNLALWLFDKPDTRITIPHPSLTLKPLIPRYTKQKQPSLTSAPKSQGIEKKYFRKYFVKEPTACSDFAVLWWIVAAAAQLHASSQWILLKAAPDVPVNTVLITSSSAPHLNICHADKQLDFTVMEGSEESAQWQQLSNLSVTLFDSFELIFSF